MNKMLSDASGCIVFLALVLSPMIQLTYASPDLEEQLKLAREKIRIAQETGVYGSRTPNGTTNVNDTNYPDCPRVSMDQLIKGGLNGSREMCTIRPPNMLDSPNIANFTMP